MSHLQFSFFVCNKPLVTGIKEFTTVQVGAFYFACPQGFLPVKNGENAMFFSLDSMQLYHSGLSMHNTILINGNTLSVMGSHMNTYCIYFIQDSDGDNIAIFNDLFLARPLLEALGFPVLYSNQQNDELTFFQNVQRLKCGEQLNAKLYGQSAQSWVIKMSALLERVDPRFKTIEESKAAFFKSLDTAVRVGLEDVPNVSIALSGGVDSGSIASLVRKYRTKLKAYTVSTDWGDEYGAAKETADYLGIELDLVHITKEEIISEVPNVIRYFHFTSPESIEIALVAHCLYKRLYDTDAENRTFFTGYGSDLLNAGVYSPFKNFEELHADCMRRVAATQLSNEFSNLAALNHGVKVFHPFWDSSVISCALRVPAEFKVKQDQDKFYFRSMMKGKLPDSTVWRKKLGAHHGTGLSQHLQQALDDGAPGSYQQTIKKIHEEIFCYGNYDYQPRKTSRAKQQAAQVG